MLVVTLYLRQYWLSWNKYFISIYLVSENTIRQVLSNALLQKISITLPWKVFKIELPSPLQKFHFSVILSFKKFGILKPPSPLEFLLTFLGVSMDIFWNYTMAKIIYRAYES